MSGDILNLNPVKIGEHHRFGADETLESAKGRPFSRLAIIGQLEDGTIHISGNNAGEALALMELVKLNLVGAR